MENSLLWKEQLVRCNFPECYLEMDPGLTGRRVTFNQVNDDDHHHGTDDHEKRFGDGDDLLAVLSPNTLDKVLVSAADAETSAATP